MRKTLASLLALAICGSAATALASQPNVLICFGDGGDGSGTFLQNALANTKLFGKVDLMDCSGQNPTLQQLQMYDGALVYTDFFGFGDANGLGDVLADYVDGGGGVLSMQYNLDVQDFSSIGGRWSQQSYDCIIPNGTQFNGTQTAAKPKDPNSPLVQGVGGIGVFTNADGQLQKNAMSLWDYNDGTTAVCLMATKATPRVDLNFYPNLDPQFMEITETNQGDALRLITNALLVVTGGLNPFKGAPNPAMFPDTGTGAISGLVTVTYTNTDKAAQTVTAVSIGGANAADFVLVKAPQLPLQVAPNGTFQVQLAFQPTVAGMLKAKLSASAANQMATADVDLVGKALPSQLVVQPTPVVVGGGQIGVPLNKDVMVINQGNAIVKVLSAAVTVDNQEFAVTKGPVFPIALGPGGSFAVTVTMTATKNGNLAGQLTITSNDMATPTINTPLTGCAGPSMISLDAGSIAYGGVNLGASSPQTVNITNAGCADLHVSAIALSGTNPGDFSLDLKNAIGTLAAGQSTPFDVTFTPTMAGNRAATVTITSDDPMTPKDVISVFGSGTMSMATVDPMTLDFGKQEVTVASMPQMLTVGNNGNGTLKVMSITFSDPSYQLMGGAMPPFTVAANASQMVGIICTPNKIGDLSGMATVATDVGDAMVTVKCTGIAPMITVMPNPVDFGNVPVFAMSQPMAVTISNTGTDDLIINSIFIAGNDEQDFISNDEPVPPFTIKPGKNTVFHIVFNPARNGIEMAEIDIACNDPAMNDPVIPLTGTGIQAGVMVSPTKLDFGGVMLMTMKSLPLTVTNTGSTDISITKIALGGTGASLFSVDKTAPLTIPQGGMTTLNVTFDPIVMGMASGVLTLTATNLAPISVQLVGVGNSPSIGITPMALSFGSVQVGMVSSPQTVTLKNAGTVPLEITSITSGNSAFVVDNSKTAKVITMGGTTTFDVTFHPVAAMASMGQIGITLKGGTKPVAEVAVSGTGTTPDMMMMMPSGGCACGIAPHRSPVVPSLAAFAALAALLVFRRRRR
jgi:hypothetical protein